MTYKVDFDDGVVRRWRVGGDRSRDAAYVPSLYVAADPGKLDGLEVRLRRDPKVVGTRFERRFLSLRADERAPVLRVDVERVDEVRQVAREVRGVHERGVHPPGTYRLFNVDFTPEFRYCLDRGVDPTPARDPAVLRLGLPERDLHRRDVSALRIDGERAAAPPADDAAVLRAVAEALDARDPDVLVVSVGDLVPLLAERAEAAGVDLRLGRLPGWERLSGRSTYRSDDRTVHSPPRYGVPGRAVVDASNGFLYRKTGLAGLLDLVERSGKPVQEAGWASIGGVLTAVQTREALARGVLVPWNKWEPEAFKSVRELHAADRGGYTFEPRVGVHEDVVEVDFSSLYPNVIRRYNVSPETVDCDCHDRADVPELGYAVCDAPGFLPDVLGPLIDARERFKAAAADDRETPADLTDADPADLRARSEALKWVLVSCFGYQGYRNSKFGRIECHEAINAYARDLLLDAKARFEDAGWRVVHGIVDSLWVAARADDPEPVESVCADVTAAGGIPLELERRYDWFALCPTRDAPGGALTKYFGAHDGRFKVRGIECRQRHTPAFVADAQRAMLRALDRDRPPGAACDVLRDRVAALRDGDVDPADLEIRRRVSKPPGAYRRRTRAVAAFDRARERGFDLHPGQDVRFVVAADGATRERERVRLAFEDPDDYDVEFYAERLRRATESVVAPFGWDAAAVDAYLADDRNARLSRYA